MIYFLVYISRSTVQNAGDILDEIANKSSANNDGMDITGVLLLNGNYFFQVLEGREDRVKALYDKIAQDSRHTEARIVLECFNDKRLFAAWCMRSFNLDDYFDVNMSSFRKKLNEAIGNEVHSKDDVVALINGFRELVVNTNQYRKKD